MNHHEVLHLKLLTALFLHLSLIVQIADSIELSFWPDLVRIQDAIVRIDIGGKMLTNHLKEIVSYRQIHVLDETHVMNAAKEDACFVSLDFEQDMKVTKGLFLKERTKTK